MNGDEIGGGAGVDGAGDAAGIAGTGGYCDTENVCAGDGRCRDEERGAGTHDIGRDGEGAGRRNQGVARLAQLVRSYFKADGHHVQFNVIAADTLRRAQADPETHRGLIVRVAGYSDYFCDLGEALQEEIIARTEHGEA